MRSVTVTETIPLDDSTLVYPRRARAQALRTHIALTYPDVLPMPDILVEVEVTFTRRWWGGHTVTREETGVVFRGYARPGGRMPRLRFRVEDLDRELYALVGLADEMLRRMADS